jgi:hypothetical protein
MELETAAEFLVGSILFGLGFCMLALALVCINNIFHKYWKPVKIWVPSYMDQSSPRFVTDEELTRVAPTYNETKDQNVK